MINLYRIQLEDILNYDETEIQIGQISSSKVVPLVKRSRKPKKISITNTE